MQRNIQYLLLACTCALSLTLVACASDNPAAPADGGGSGGGTLPFETFQAASLVIGQPDMTAGTPNAGAGSNMPNAVGLGVPRGNPALGFRLSAGGNPNSLYVADARNLRVVSYGGLPAVNGVAADFALGQPDLTSRDGLDTSDSTLAEPVDCLIADRKLFVTDQDANRILVWNSLPAANTDADFVIGQPDLTSDEEGDGASGLRNPSDAWVAGGRLFVADRSNHRVLIWNSLPTTNGQPADVVVGQPDFNSIDPGTSATSLNLPSSVWADDSRLVIVDTINHRVLIFNSIPTANGEAADVVVGQPDFTSNTSGPATATSMLFPEGATSDGSNLFVADTENHRVLIFPFPTTNGAGATGVLGQSNFTLNERNDPDQDGEFENPSERTFFTPSALTIFGERLVVTDTGNYRLLVFEAQ